MSHRNELIAISQVLCKHNQIFPFKQAFLLRPPHSPRNPRYTTHTAMQTVANACKMAKAIKNIFSLYAKKIKKMENINNEPKRFMKIFADDLMHWAHRAEGDKCLRHSLRDTQSERERYYITVKGKGSPFRNHSATINVKFKNTLF